MKRWLGVAGGGVLLFGLLHLFSGLMLAPFSSLVSSNLPPIPADAIRLRIIANSNSPRDQRIKLIVRDHILAFLSPRLPKDSSHGETSAILRRNAPIVNQLANEALAQQGVFYKATTAFGPTHFPEKFYGNQIYPAGTYEALRIILGKGRGHNWWCVVFPQLCYASLDVSVIPQTGAFPQTPPLAKTTETDPNGRQIPVELRLAIVDYGSEWLQTAEVRLRSLWQQILHTV